MRAATWHGPRDVRVEEKEEPTLASDRDAIVRVTTASICGTDLHVYRGELTVVPGTVLGHEFMTDDGKSAQGRITLSTGEVTWSPSSRRPRALPSSRWSWSAGPSP
jgi:Threonine dehydrogenase and related Zn-dependent dehydrogenases